MHSHSYSKDRIGGLVTRKLKTSMMHIVDLLKARVPVKAKRTRHTKQRSMSQTATPTSPPVKQPLRRTLTADEITEAELALKRLQAEKKRLEDLLNTASDRHLVYQQQQPSDDENTNNNVKKELIRVPRYQQKVAFMLHDVFSAEDMKQLLKELEANKEDSKCMSQCELTTTHSETMAKRLWPVLQGEVPKTWMGNSLLGLSNRCTVEKQSEGYSHKPHMDEAYEPVEGKEKSFFSVYVFLNDEFEGGESSFLKNWQPSTHDVQVKPKKGSVLVHQHNLLHEVTSVTSGEKSVARLDVMYNTSKRDLLSEMYD